MAKPILFTTITRAAYEALSDKDKIKTNYQIKETDGKITKVIPGLEGGEGGAGAFYVTFTEENDEWTADKTFEEVKTAYESGKVIFGNIDGILGNLVEAWFDDVEPYCSFEINHLTENFGYLHISYGSDGEITANEYVTSEVPVPDRDDDGKVLGAVNDGPSGVLWKPITVPSNDFVVTYTNDNGTYTADKTFAEIKAAFEAGKNVKGKMYISGADYYFSLYSYTTSQGGAAMFSYSYYDINNATIKSATIIHASTNLIRYGVSS